jgi:hypothetical protein
LSLTRVQPEDSQHPDREADFEVYVESWLSEEEYRDAKSRLVLVGQGTFKRLEPKLGIDVEVCILCPFDFHARLTYIISGMSTGKIFYGLQSRRGPNPLLPARPSLISKVIATIVTIE